MHTGAETGAPFVDVVLDQARAEGHRPLEARTALDHGVPVGGIAEAVFARPVSGPGSRDPRAAGRRAISASGRPRAPAVPGRFRPGTSARRGAAR
ncbi:hypothetical protein [Actinomadura roseirufa]|uniref:hypothetical protein n=1 Tax=Actinomadura roseirufa TaxID=2094049 RepID=UPI00104169FE|nr:hypothetical protein [Actinomadura roseirufa]